MIRTVSVARNTLLITAVVFVAGGCVAGGRSPAIASTEHVQTSGSISSCEGARTLQRDLSISRKFDPDTQIYVTETGDLCRFDGK